MKLKDLTEAIKLLSQRDYYCLNDPNGRDTFILEYNKKNKTWEYYYLNERGGKSWLKTFATEEEACEYALKAAISFAKRFTDSQIDLAERRYLNKPMPPEQPLMRLDQIFNAIKLLDSHKDDYIDNLDQATDVCTSEYNREKKTWEYGLFTRRVNLLEWKVFATEVEAREYVINEAIETIRAFGNAWKNGKLSTDAD